MDFQSRTFLKVAGVTCALLVLGSGARAQEDGQTESPLFSAVRLAENFIAENPPHKLGWSWGQGIGLYGIARLAAATNSEGLRRYVAEYHAHHLREGLPRINYPDRCPPALSALALAEGGDPSALTSALKVASYLREEDRNALGAIDHLGSVWFRPFYPRSIWVDSLMMYAVFAAQWAEWADDAEMREFALAQPAIFASRLQDPETGLFRHAYFTQKRKLKPKSETYWLRGNGWAAASLVEILERTPRDHPERERMIHILRRLLAGAMPFRARDGLWETVMNRPGYSYPETSGSALLGYAMARAAKRGYVEADYLQEAWQTFFGVRGYLRMAEHGYSMGGISGATNPSSALLYKLVPVKRDKPYGVGAYLLLATELANEN